MFATTDAGDGLPVNIKGKSESLQGFAFLSPSANLGNLLLCEVLPIPIHATSTVNHIPHVVGL
jgi:hypothetical protein